MNTVLHLPYAIVYLCNRYRHFWVNLILYLSSLDVYKLINCNLGVLLSNKQLCQNSNKYDIIYVI